MARPRAKQDEGGTSLEQLIGVKPPDRVIQQSRKRLEQRFAQEFRAAETRRKEAARALEPAYAPLRNLARDGGKQEAAVRRLGELSDRHAKQKLILPKGVLEPEPRIFSGSISATVRPPYTWPWTWSATSGSPVSSVSADRNTGALRVSLASGGSGGSAAGAAAVGIYFRPVTSLGYLWLMAAPALSWFWWTYNAFASSHSDGWLGLYIGAYTTSWTQYAVPVDQQIYLWNESHSFLASPDGSGTNSGYPLFASTVVNSSSIYEMWVWCGGSVSGVGDHTFYGSYAGGLLNLRVPSMTWTLW